MLNLGVSLLLVREEFMRKTRRLYVLLFIISLSSVIRLSMIPQLVEASPTPTIYVDPPVSYFVVSGYFTIDIKIANAIDFYGWQLTLNYQASVINITKQADIVEGPFLKSTGTTFFLTNIGNGSTLVLCTLLGAVAGVNGSGTLASVTFKALVANATNINLLETKLGDSHGNPINHTAVGGYAQVGTSTPTGQNVTITPSDNVNMTFDQVTSAGATGVNVRDTGPPPPSGTELIGPYYDIQTSATFIGTVQIGIAYNDTGLTPEEENALELIRWDQTVVGDVKQDGIIDVFDLIKVGIAFGSKPGDTNWNPDADIKQDGIIDVFDLIKVGINFGRVAAVWITVTTWVDTENNIIYGETDHLSIFGVRG